jgi:hypothetical protein
MIRITVILMATAFCAWGLIGGGLQGGVISPDNLDISFYIGGHLSVVEMLPNLILWLPGEYWFSSHEDTTYHQNTTHKKEVTVLGLDLVGGYAFAVGSTLITPEASFQMGGYDSFKLGVDFTFR